MIPSDNPWRDAVHDALVVAHILSAENAEDPRKAINDLLSWESAVALDPSVSSGARDLIERGKYEAVFERTSMRRRLVVRPLLKRKRVQIARPRPLARARLRSLVRTQHINEARSVRAFAGSVLRSARTYLGSDVDGADVQDWAIKFGLLEEVEVTEPCGENCGCAFESTFPTTCVRPSSLGLDCIDHAGG